MGRGEGIVEPGCIFCAIDAGRAPTSFAYEDERVFAIMSLEQPTPYKVLVIPRDPVATVYDLTDEQAAAIFRATVRVARAVREASGCAGLNLVQRTSPPPGRTPSTSTCTSCRGSRGTASCSGGSMPSPTGRSSTG